VRIVATLKTMKLPLILCVILIGSLTFSSAGESMKISGIFVGTYIENLKIDVGDIQGHTVSLTESEGVNQNTGDNVVMEGAKAVNIGFADAVNGNGMQHGYITMANGEDATVARWEGNVTTVMSAENTPMTSFEGTFTYISGTGIFENISGSGSYTGHFTSKTEYTVEWHGDYSIQK